MTKDGPTCSLGPRDLERRLEAIGQLCDESLIAHSEEGNCHTLRFRPDEGVRQRLEDLVKAEAECCPFLNFTLSEKDGDLILSYEVPPLPSAHGSWQERRQSKERHRRSGGRSPEPPAQGRSTSDERESG